MMTSNPNNITPIKVGNAIAEILFSILQKYFSNGFRINDYIELLRFREFTHNEVGRTIKSEITDEILTRYISACGTLFDGKIYPVSKQAQDNLKEIIERFFASGAKIIFYEEFYNKRRPL